MRKIQIGTILHKDEDTTNIYERFPEYFIVDDAEEWFVKYVIAKEPSDELVTAIAEYYKKIKEENKAHDEFVDMVATEVLKGLSQKDKDYIFLHPDSTEHHFGMGLGIRNKYIHGEDLQFNYCHPDGLSSEITARIASMIIENYDYDNPFYRHLYDDFSFNHLRRLYYAVKGEYPDTLIDQFADLPDDYAAAKTAREKVKEVVFDEKRFKRLCDEYGVKQEKYEECKGVIDSYNEKNWDLVPYDIVLLTSNKLNHAFREQMLRLLKAVLDQTPRMALELPVYIFNQKDSVLLAVDAMGQSLKRFPKFNSDDEVIRTALSSNGEAIQYVHKNLRDNSEYIDLALSEEHGCALKMRCMIKYRDDEEKVRIALEANGRNIEYASNRLRDDLEIAKFAVTHQKDWYPESTVCNLSARLRDSLEIALLDIHKGHACVDSYSRRLRDCDEVAEALIETDNDWKLYLMSKRIQKKYDENYDD